MDSQTQQAPGPASAEQMARWVDELRRHSQLALPPPGRTRAIDTLRRAWARLWGQDWIAPAMQQQQRLDDLAIEAITGLIQHTLATARQLDGCSARLDEQSKRLDTYFTWLDEQNKRLDTYFTWLDQHGRLREADHTRLDDEARLSQAMRAGYAATRLEIDDIAGEVRRLQIELRRLAAGKDANAERGDDRVSSIPR